VIAGSAIPAILSRAPAAERATASWSRGEDLAVEGVAHAYAGARAIDNVSFTIPGGTIAAILGPSGCGKSTMLRIVSGLVRPMAGVVRIGTRDVTEVPARERRVGMVFQNYALFPHMTVRENVGYGLSALPRQERRDRVDRLLSLVRLEAFAERLPRQLSGGQQQRVAVARALAPRPALLLLDEPFAALDRALRSDMQVEFVKLQRELGITTILVTHDQEEAQAVAETLIIMNNGRIEQMGRAADIYDRPESLFVNGFVGQASVVPATVSADGPGGATLRLASGDDIHLPHAVNILPGSSVVLVLRPEHVSLHAAPRAGSLVARRILAVPQGAQLLHELTLADGTALKAIEERGLHAPDAEAGAEVHVTFALDRCRVFPAP
jgi:putative spermidine/putrescine transport system ATP-binding protein